jgi:cell division protein FtsI (penicillin-binding protein 3)
VSIGRDFGHAHNKKFVSVDGAVKQTLDISRPRIIFICAFFCLAYIALAIRLLELGTAGSAEEVMNRRVVPMLPEFHLSRGAIVDRNGEMIATNLTTASLYANAREVIDAEEAAKQLTQVFPSLSYQELHEKLTSKKSFVWLKRKITPKEQEIVNTLGIPGLYFQREEKRIYPHGNVVSHVLGMVGMDGRGLMGIEKSYDAYLQSEESMMNPLMLSMDVRVQNILHEELMSAMHQFRALGAAGVIMDANNGEVIAMASLPDFDPNNPARVDQEATFNRATLGVYEMGSTFKAFTTAQALDQKIVKLNDSYDATKPLVFGRHRISDFHPENRWLTIPEIFVHSSNIGTARMAIDIGEKRQRAFMEKLGMLKPVATDLPERGSPLFPEKWRRINAMTIAYGHGIAVTPMHLVRATAAMVNGGYLMTPTFVKQKADEAVVKEQVINSRTSAIMRKLYQKVVYEGTGGKAKAEGYLVGGKTGTAEKLENGRYKHGATLSSFVGAFPIDNPQYVIFVVVDEPKGDASTFGFATGGYTAAPVVGSVVRRIAPMLGIMPTVIQQEAAISPKASAKAKAGTAQVKEPALAAN